MKFEAQVHGPWYSPPLGAFIIARILKSCATCASAQRLREAAQNVPGHTFLRLGRAVASSLTLSVTGLSLFLAARLNAGPDPGSDPQRSPPFTTSDPNGGWAEGGYYIHNNMWNSAKYNPCTSTLHAFSHDNWHVVTRMDNKARDGAVKTYPNVHKDYASVPIASFDSMTSTFAETSPGIGIYNVAYDLWINGVARPGCTEIMIWTDNFHQVPGGKYVEDATLGEHSYKVYKRPGTSAYIAFVTTTNFTSGTVNLLDIMNWTIAKGWLTTNSTVNQICFGVEMVSTDDTDATFRVSAFSIDARSRNAKEGTNKSPGNAEQKQRSPGSGQ